MDTNQQSMFDLIPMYPPNPFKPGSQNFRVYSRLVRYGRVKNIEIMLDLGGPRIMNTTGRAADVRDFLKPHGIKLHCERIHDGLFEYWIGVQ